MKKVTTVLSLIGFLFLGLNGIAQTSIGVTTGFQTSDAQLVGINQSISPDIKPYTGLNIGMTVEHGLNNNVSIVSGAQFAAKGLSFQEGTSFNIIGIDIPVGAEARLTTKNIEIPLMMKFQVGGDHKIYAKAGTSLNIGMTGRFKTVANTFIDITLTDNAIDFGSDMFDRTDIAGKMALGGSMKYGAGNVFAEVGYTHGFNQGFRDPIFETGFRNTAVSMNVGFAMNL